MFSFARRPLNQAAVCLVFLLAAIAAGRPGPARAADYLIQPDDVLAVTVSGEPDLSKDYKVDDEGNISIPSVGKIKVSGKSLPDIQTLLDKKIHEFVKVFELTVLVVGEGGSKCLVYGEVAKPGSIKVRNGAKLLDILTEAGMPTSNADRKQIKISHRGGKQSETVDLDAITNDLSLNPEILPGDTITVPSKISRSVSVEGEVGAPGEKPIEQVKTAYGAIKASGPTDNVDWTRVIIRHKGSNTPLIVDLSAVRVGSLKDDLELQEGDRITVQSKFAGTATVNGAVQNPGEKSLNGPTQIQDLIITQCGGLKPEADRRRIQVIREGKTEPTLVDLVEVENGTLLSNSPKLAVKPGDTIYVPLATARLDGQIRTLGLKPIGDNNHLLDFITNAGGGMTERADQTRVQIRRGGKIVKVIDLTEIAAGIKNADDPDLEVKPGDWIFVPDDSHNRFLLVGGVNKPGPYPLKPGMTLLDALAMGQGLTERARYEQIVIAPGAKYDEKGNFRDAPAEEKPADDGAPPKDGEQPAKPGEDASEKHGKKKDEKRREKSKGKEKSPEDLGLTVVDYRKLIKGDFRQNPVIHPGDRILVAERSPNQRSGEKGGILSTLGRLLYYAPIF